MAATERRRRRGAEMPSVPVTDTAPRGSGLVPKDMPEVSAQRRAARIAELNGDEPLPTAAAAAVAKKKGGMTSEESMAAAKLRAAEILEHDIGITEDDKFYVDQNTIPDGWAYVWRRISVYGKEDPQYQVRIAQTGWRPVPGERHPEMMPSTGGPYLTIDREGMRLFEIPAEVHKLLQQRQHRQALEQVRVKTTQLQQAPTGTFSRTAHPQVAPRIARGYEPLIVPDA